MEESIILERLVSIKSNAEKRALQESKDHIENRYYMKAFLLEKGIDGLIIEVQNVILWQNLAEPMPPIISSRFFKRQVNEPLIEKCFEKA
jgi:hypothetical protein